MTPHKPLSHQQHNNASTSGVKKMEKARTHCSNTAAGCDLFRTGRDEFLVSSQEFTYNSTVNALFLTKGLNQLFTQIKHSTSMTCSTADPPSPSLLHSIISNDLRS